MDTSAAGTYRVFADVVPTGHDGLTLGTDLAVAGDFAPEPPVATERAQNGPGSTATRSGSPGTSAPGRPAPSPRR